MEFYNFGDTDPADAIVAALEKQTGEKVFTMRVLNRASEEKGFFVLVAFENKSMLEGYVSILASGSDLAVRVRGKFL